MPTPKWWAATEPAEVAEELMAAGYEELHSHGLLDIRYVFTNKEAGKDGCKVYATTSKVPALMASQLQKKGLAPNPSEVHAIAPHVFIIKVWADGWEILDAKQRRALMHHELMHIDPLDVKLRPHSIEEHNLTARRFGDWHRGLTLFNEAMTGDHK